MRNANAPHRCLSPAILSFSAAPSKNSEDERISASQSLQCKEKERNPKKGLTIKHCYCSDNFLKARSNLFTSSCSGMPIAWQSWRSSIKSKRRSPFSYLDTNDCG